jgi:glycerol uptake facilitator protein
VPRRARRNVPSGASGMRGSACLGADRSPEWSLASGDRLRPRHHAGSLHVRCSERGAHQSGDHLGTGSLGGFAWRSVVPYVFAQVLGAFLAAATLFVLFNPYLKARELEKDVVRGTPGSEITAMCYGEFFPSPGPLSNASGRYSVDAHERLNSLVSEQAAFLAELLGTLVLALVVFAITDEGNPGAPPSGFALVIVGLTVAVLISVIAPLTQACFNPARDFGRRLFASLAGRGRIALPGPRGIGFVSVYIGAPLLGAIIGSGLYTKLLKPSSAVDSDTANRSRERC